MNLPPFKLEQYFNEYEFKAEYLLANSDCETVSIAELLLFEPDAKERFLAFRLGYTEVPGAESLRREICRIYSTLEAGHVLVHAGAEEAIFLFMHSLLKAGDHVVVQRPCYQSLHEIPRGIGCDVSSWQAREERGWSLNLSELERLLRPETRAIVVNFPHNPTGYLMVKSDFLELNRLAQERGIVLFSDEVYRECEYAAQDRLSAACDINDTAVSLGVLSKTYGLPGLRIGWAATRNSRLLERMAELKAYTTICSSGPSEFLAEVALRHREKLAQRNINFIRKNLTLLDDFFVRHSGRFSWIRPMAGPIAFPKLTGEAIGSFCRRLFEKSGVLLVPGTVFDDIDNHFRIGFGRKNLPAALVRLEEFLASNR